VILTNKKTLKKTQTMIIIKTLRTNKLITTVMRLLKMVTINAMVPTLVGTLKGSTEDPLKLAENEETILQEDLGIADLEIDVLQEADLVAKEILKIEITLTTEMLTRRPILKFTSLLLSVKPEKMILKKLLKNSE
jgi:hypothetical protein